MTQGTEEDHLASVCQLSACESDTPCRFGRCNRAYPWRRTPSSVLEAVISLADAATLTGELSLEQYVATHQQCFDAWHFTVDEYVDAFRTAAPSDDASCRRFVEHFAEILLFLRRSNAKPGSTPVDHSVKPKKRKASTASAPKITRHNQQLTLITN